MSALTTPGSAVPDLESQQVADSHPRVVFLPFTEALLHSSGRNTPCWQQKANTAHSDSANYPVFDLADESTSVTLVPFDQEWMSLSILKHGRWEPLTR